MPVSYTQDIYSGASGAVTTSAALATTYTGLLLTNPVGSTVSLILESASFVPLVAQTAALSIGLLGGSSATAVTQTTAVAPTNNYLGGPGGYGLLAKAATLPVAPTLLFLLGSLMTGAITVQDQAGAYIDLNGGQPMVVVPPGAYVGFYTSAASVASSLNLSFQWAEVPE